MDEKRKISSKSVWKIIILAGIVLSASIFMMFSFANDETISGEFVIATRVYMPDNTIKLVVYFNETNNTKFFIFDDWDARHSILLSNMETGTRIKVVYRDYVFRDCKEIVGIEML